MTKQKYIDESDEFFIEERKTNTGSLRQETELFNADSYIPHPLINVRLIILPKGGENWEIMVDKGKTDGKRVVFSLKGSRFSKKEREFLRTPLGMSFIINGYKQGWKTVSEYKRQVSKCMA